MPCCPHILCVWYSKGKKKKRMLYKQFDKCIPQEMGNLYKRTKHSSILSHLRHFDFLWGAKLLCTFAPLHHVECFSHWYGFPESKVASELPFFALLCSDVFIHIHRAMVLCVAPLCAVYGMGMVCLELIPATCVHRFHPDHIQEFMTMRKRKSEGWKCDVSFVPCQF